MEMSQTMEIQFQKDIEYIFQDVLKILQDELGKDAIAYYEFDSSAQLLTTKINGDVFSIEFFLKSSLTSDFEDEYYFGIYISKESDPEYAIHEQFEYPISKDSKDSIIDYIVDEVLKR